MSQLLTVRIENDARKLLERNLGDWNNASLEAKKNSIRSTTESLRKLWGLVHIWLGVNKPEVVECNAPVPNKYNLTPHMFQINIGGADFLISREDVDKMKQSTIDQITFKGRILTVVTSRIEIPSIKRKTNTSKPTIHQIWKQKDLSVGDHYLDQSDIKKLSQMKDSISSLTGKSRVRRSTETYEQWDGRNHERDRILDARDRQDKYDLIENIRVYGAICLPDKDAYIKTKSNVKAKVHKRFRQKH